MQPAPSTTLRPHHPWLECAYICSNAPQFPSSCRCTSPYSLQLATRPEAATADANSQGRPKAGREVKGAGQAGKNPACQ